MLCALFESPHTIKHSKIQMGKTSLRTSQPVSCPRVTFNSSSVHQDKCMMCMCAQASYLAKNRGARVAVTSYAYLLSIINKSSVDKYVSFG